MTVEINVSRREGHVTLAVSALTCCRKVKGFVVFDAMPLVLPPLGLNPKSFLDFRCPETPCPTILNRESRYVWPSN
jgi:hypothetical protein